MPLKITRLEERIVLEAAAVDALEAVDHLADMCDPSADSSVCADPAADSSTDAHASGDAQGAESSDSHDDGVHVLAVSSTVDDAQVLAGAAMEGVLTYVYDGHSSDLDAILDGIRDMLGGQKADTIAFATHDLGIGQFHLSGEYAVSTLSLVTDADLSAFWSNVGDLLAEGGRVDILACDVAGSESGLDLLTQLEAVTGHDVAASTDATGNPDAGGDWILETHGIDAAATYFNSDHLADFHDLLWAQDEVDSSPGYASAVDTDGEWAVVGSYSDGDGVVRIFHHEGTAWNEVQVLAASDVSATLAGHYESYDGVFDVEDFGYSVAIDGDHLVIGAPGTDFDYEVEVGVFVWDWFNSHWEYHMESRTLADVGAVFTYVYDNGSWQQESMLTASGHEPDFDEYAENAFGFDVDVAGGYLIVGEPGNDADILGTANVGKAHGFEWGGTANGWVWFGSLQGPSLDSWAGTSVAIDASGRYAIGFPGESGSQANCGVITGVAHNPLTIQTIYGKNNSLAGTSVALDGDTLVVGAPGHDNNTYTDMGAIRMYEWTGSQWDTAHTQMADRTRESYDYFGSSVAVYGDYVVVGAPGDDAGGTDNAGAMYLYNMVTNTWTKFDCDTPVGGMSFGMDVAIGPTEVFMATFMTNRGAFIDRYLNAAPVGGTDQIGTDEDSPVTVDAATLLGNDTDVDATDILYISAVGAAAAGTVTPVTDSLGNITGVTYDPNGQFDSLSAGETTTDTFTYTVADGYGGTDEVTVTVTITGANDAVVISGLDDATFSENSMDASGSWQIIDADVSLTDVDATNLDGATLVIDYIDQLGTDTQTNNDRLMVTSDTELWAQYWSTGNIVDRATGLVIGTIDAVENGSSGHAMVITFTADATLAQVEHVVELLAYRNYDNTPDPTRTLRVTFTDGDGTTVSDPAYSTITITPDNDAPYVNNGGNTVSWTEGDPGVVLNDQISVWDPEVDPIAWAMVTITNATADDLLAFTAAHGITGAYVYDAATGTGTLTLTGEALSWQYNQVLRTVTYENTGLDPTVHGSRAACDVEFQVADNTRDPSGVSLTAATTVNLTGVNQAPDANADQASTTVGQFVDIDVLANDTDVDSNAFTVSVEPGDGPANGAVSIISGVITYTPDAGFTGTDTFTYTVDDGSGGTDTALVTVDVYGEAHLGMDLSIIADDLPAMFTASTIDSATGTFYFAGDSFQGSLYSVDPATGDWTLITDDFTPDNVYFRFDYSDIEFVNGTIYIAGDYDIRDEATYTAIGFWPDGGTRDGRYAFLAWNGASSTVLNDPSLNLNEVDVRYGFATADGQTFFLADGWGTAGGNMVSFDLASPDALSQESGGVGWMTGVEYDADSGLFYVSSSQGGTNADIFTYDPATNTWSQLVDGLPGGFAGNFAVEPGGDAIYHWSNNAIYRYDVLTGADEVVVDALESVDHFEYQEPIIAASSDGVGLSLYFTNGDTLYEVDGIGDVNALSDSADTLVDQAVDIDLLANDTAVSGTLSVVSVGAAANGTVHDNGDGTVTYTPNTGFSGTDTFIYTVQDSQGGTDSATVTVDVYGQAHQSLNISIVADDLPSMFTASTVDAATGTLYFAGDSFQGALYTVDPATGAWVQVTDDFTPDNVYFRFDYSDIEFVNGTVYIAGDYDTRDESTYTAIPFWPDGGTRDGAFAFLAWNGASSTVLNDPSLNLNEVDVRYGFATADGTTFLLADGWGTAGGNPVTLSLANPDALGQESGSVGWMTGVEYDAASGLFYISSSQRSNADVFTYDPDTNTWTQLVDQLPGGFAGNFAVHPGGKYIYHWVDNAICRFDPATGEDQVVVDNLAAVNHFEYQEPIIAASSDGDGLSLYFTNGDVLYEVDGIDEVTANHDSGSTLEDTSLTLDVLANDVVPDGDVRSVTIEPGDGPANGSVVVNPGMTVTYTPNADWYGTDTFTYTVTDAEGFQDTAQVTITVSPVNDNPVAVDDGAPDATGFTTDQDTAFTTGNVLANDYDVDNDHSDLSVTGINTTGTLGQVSYNGNGTFAYNPNGAFDYLALGESAQDTFTYTISDGSSGTATATVTVTINGLNDAPVAGNDAYGTAQNPATNEDTPLHVDSNLGLLINDYDVDTDPLDPVNGVDPAPVIYDYGTQNGVDPSTGLPAYDHVSAMGATVTVNLDGSFDYNPTASAALQALNPGETATDTFTYTYLDRYGLFSTATVSIVVGGVNDAPTANDDAFTTSEDAAFLGDVIDPEFVWGAESDPAGMDTDPEDNDLNLASVTVEGVTYDFADTEDGFLAIGLTNGSELLIHTWGLFVFNPNEAYDGLAEGESGSVTFSYVLMDEHGGTDDATVTITIDGVNDAPFAVGNGIYQGVVNGDFEAGDTSWVGVINGGEGYVEFTNGELVVTGSSLLGELFLGDGDGEGLGSLLDGDFFITFPWGSNYAEQWMQIDTSLDFDLVSYTNFLWDLAGEFLGGLGELGFEDLHGLLDSTPVLYVNGVEYQLYDDGTVDGSLGGEVIRNWNQVDETIHFSLDQFTGQLLIKLGVKSQFDLFPGVAVFDNVSDGGDVVLHTQEGYTVADNGALITPNVLDNDMDIDGDVLTLVGYDDTLTRGTVTDNGDGTFTYNPAGAYSGLARGTVAYDTFTYTVRDAHGVEHTATVVITITGTTPPELAVIPGGDLGLTLSPNFYSSLGHSFGEGGGGTGGGSINGYGSLLAQGLSMFGNRDNPWGPSYPDNPFSIETYLENSDAAKEAFNNAIDQIPGVSQLTKIALKDFNADILDLMFGDGAEVTLADLQDLVNDLELLVQHMGPAEMAQFRGVLAVWVQSLKIQINTLAGQGEDVEGLLNQLKALEEQITLTA